MPTVNRTAAKPVAPSRRTEARLPAISVGVALSKKIDKGIVDVANTRQRQLRFTQKNGFVSPLTGNPLQVVYLAKSGNKSGLGITYIDSKEKQFWAQGPGVSGLARGPFKLGAGIATALHKLNAAEAKAAAKEAKAPATRDAGRGFIAFQATGSETAARRRELNNVIGGGGGSGGRYWQGGGGSGGGNVWGGGGGGGGGGGS